MRPRLIVAMPRGAAQVPLTVPAMYGLLAPLAAFSLAINMAVAFTVAHGMRLSGEGIAGHTQNLQTCAGTRTERTHAAGGYANSRLDGPLNLAIP